MAACFPGSRLRLPVLVKGRIYFFYKPLNFYIPIDYYYMARGFSPFKAPIDSAGTPYSDSLIDCRSPQEGSPLLGLATPWIAGVDLAFLPTVLRSLTGGTSNPMSCQQSHVVFLSHFLYADIQWNEAEEKPAMTIFFNCSKFPNPPKFMNYHFISPSSIGACILSCASISAPTH